MFSPFEKIYRMYAMQMLTLAISIEVILFLDSVSYITFLHQVFLYFLGVVSNLAVNIL